MSPQGTPLTQPKVQQTSECQQLILLAGRYEGIDQRVIDRDVDEEWSIGDYVLSGGEIPAMAFLDAIIRLLPGAVGDPESIIQESFQNNLLDHPHYTRPREIDGQKVPNILFNGDHQRILDFRARSALISTWQKRPDLLKQCSFNKEQQKLIDSLNNHQLGEEEDERHS